MNDETDTFLKKIKT